MPPRRSSARPSPSSAAGDSAYQLPPRAVVDMIDAPPTPHATVSADKRWLLLLEPPSFPTIAEVAAPERRLAGLRIDPRTGGPSRRNFLVGMTLRDLHDRKGLRSRPITGLPKNPRLSDFTWAPDGKRIGFTTTADDGAVTLWVLELATARARRVSDRRLAGAGGQSYSWLPNSSGVLARLVPKDRGPEPTAPMAPPGPIVQESVGRKAPARTYQDLLRGPHDELLFEHYMRTQLARISLAGKVTPVGRPALFGGFDASPDGKYLLVSQLHRPFSYRVPIDRFPARIEIWDRAGKLVRLIADLPLQEEVPVDFAAVAPGPRSFEWRADADATLCWVQARDGGDPKRQADVRDEVFCLAAPFKEKQPRSLARLALRYGGITWGTGKVALINEWWWADRKTRTWIIQPDSVTGKSGKKASAEAPPVLLWDRSSEDRYSDPGRPVIKNSGRGSHVMAFAADGESVFLFGSGASDEGDRPFVDRLNLNTRSSERLWRSEPPYYEIPWDLLDREGTTLLTRRESVAEPPQYLRRDLPAGTHLPLTRFKHPSPQLAKVEKRLIQYKRADGVALSGMLYLPPGWKQGQDPPLPLLMWAYPQSFKSAASAGQITDSPYRFARISWASPLWALPLGYAVLDDPTFPIVGQGTVEPNDTYVAQLSAGAQAAVEEVVRLGIADRDRIAIGGHSYGAFMTANLLAHTKLFRAGIARSGAYNRTLTPFGFQAEERTFWEAPQTYMEMSPYAHADRIDVPILIIHGEADNNSGTFPIQSERLFEALKGLGGRARLVMLPAESHGYRARESVMHTLWEMATWLDTYVKKAGPRSAETTKPAETAGSAAATEPTAPAAAASTSNAS
jgi:dipeptidyl aminopeptidase/acylaminoacyl peptidase